MPTLELHPRTAVRAAGLVDVPAVVRLFAPSPASPRLSAPDPDSPAVDWEQAQRAMRLMLAHHALEEGQVWVAERADGALLAAAIWLPPGIGSGPPGPRINTLLARELDTSLPERPVLSTALSAVGPEAPHWTVVTVCAPGDAETDDRTVIAELLTPGLDAVHDEDATAVAITLSARHADQLRPLGFRGPREVPLVPGASVWLTTRHSRSPASGPQG